MYYQVDYDRTYKKDQIGMLEIKNYNKWNVKFIWGVQY